MSYLSQLLGQDYTLSINGQADLSDIFTAIQKVIIQIATV